MKKARKIPQPEFIAWNVYLSNRGLLGCYTFPRKSIKSLFKGAKIVGQDIFLK